MQASYPSEVVSPRRTFPPEALCDRVRFGPTSSSRHWKNASHALGCTNDDAAAATLHSLAGGTRRRCDCPEATLLLSWGGVHLLCHSRRVNTLFGHRSPTSSRSSASSVFAHVAIRDLRLGSALGPSPADGRYERDSHHVSPTSSRSAFFISTPSTHPPTLPPPELCLLRGSWTSQSDADECARTHPHSHHAQKGQTGVLQTPLLR